MRAIFIVIALTLMGCTLSPTEVLPPMGNANKAVVFDIDSTLTPKDTSIYTARDNAAKAVRLYADKGYQIIYLSARNRYFQFNIPRFLSNNGFPDGNIHVPQSAEDRSDFAAFKYAILQRYLDAGWQLEYGYGDSSTDFEAYVEAGIKPEHIYALQRAGASECQPGPWAACLQTWNEQLATVSATPPVIQEGL